MIITRRQFLKYCSIAAGALGLSAIKLYKLNELMAQVFAPRADVIWLNGAGCTGCTMSFMNTINYGSIGDLIIPWTEIESITGITGKDDGVLEINFIETLNTAVGARAIDTAFDVLNSEYDFILCLEGAIQTADDGRYCQIWRVRKEHSILKSGSFVWSSQDRFNLNVPNDTSEPIVVVNAIDLTSNRTTTGTTELYQGSILATSSVLQNSTWVEKVADRAALVAEGYGFDGDKKINVSGGTLSAPITLSGRAELATGSTLTTGSKISASSLVYDVGDRVSFGGVYTASPRIATGVTKTIHEDITLTGAVMIAATSKLMQNTVLKIGSWVESSADRTALGGSYDTDNKIQTGDITLSAVQTLSGRIEAITGSVLIAREIDSANYLYNSNDEDRTFKDEVLNFAISDNCAVVVAVGTCASYGGVPAAMGDVTGARGLISTGRISGGYQTVNIHGYWDLLLKNRNISRTQWESLVSKTICIPGCPPHPDWIVGTLIYYITEGELPAIDGFRRPYDYFNKYQCDNCIWRVNDSTQATLDIDDNTQVSQSGRTIGNSPKMYYYKYNSSYEGCIGILGCKGQRTRADCSYRRWNGDGPSGEISGGEGGVSWCVLTRAGCHGCTDPRFPDGWGPFFMYK